MVGRWKSSGALDLMEVRELPGTRGAMQAKTQPASRHLHLMPFPRLVTRHSEGFQSSTMVKHMISQHPSGREESKIRVERPIPLFHHICNPALAIGILPARGSSSLGPIGGE